MAQSTAARKPERSEVPQATGAIVEKRRDTRDIVDDVRFRADVFARDMGLPREGAEWMAAGEILNEIEAEAEVFTERYGMEVDQLKQRLEQFITPDVAYAVHEPIGKLERLKMNAQGLMSQFRAKVEELRTQQPEKGLPVEAVRSETSVVGGGEGSHIEVGIEAKLSEWEAAGFLVELVEVEKGKPVPVGERLKELIGFVKEERVRVSKLRPVSTEDLLPLREAEQELQELSFFVEHEQRLVETQEFLHRPLTEIHAKLRDGERHPRLDEYAAFANYLELCNLRERKVSRSGFKQRSAEDVAAASLSSGLAAAYRDLSIGLLAGASDEIQNLAKRTARQIENNVSDAALVSMDELTRLLKREEDQAARSALDRLLTYRAEVEKQSGDFTRSSEVFSAELYTALGEAQPERAESLRERARLEMSLRKGRILDIRPIKQVKGTGKKAGSVKAEAVHGNDKVLRVMLAELDEAGNEMRHPNGLPRMIEAIAKSSMTEGYFRGQIPPETSARIEWQASQEAVMFGSDLIPPTVVRSEGLPFGEMSFQLVVKGSDKRGMPTEARSATTVDDWETVVSPQDLQEAAVLDLLQGAEDAGEPNYLVTEVGEGEKRLHLIDRGLSQPRRRTMVVSSALAAAAGAGVHADRRRLSTLTQQKLERYVALAPKLEASLKMSLRFDVQHTMNDKLVLARELLRVGKFGDYEKKYQGQWDVLRDDGRMSRKYRRKQPEQDVSTPGTYEVVQHLPPAKRDNKTFAS